MERKRLKSLSVIGVGRNKLGFWMVFTVNESELMKITNITNFENEKVQSICEKYLYDIH